jgi:hypothetical protein
MRRVLWTTLRELMNDPKLLQKIAEVSDPLKRSLRERAGDISTDAHEFHLCALAFYK